ARRAFDHLHPVAEVGAQHRALIQEREQPSEVAALRGGEPRVHDLAVAARTRPRRRRGAPHPPPRAGLGRAYRAGENLAGSDADRGERRWSDFVATPPTSTREGVARAG